MKKNLLKYCVALAALLSLLSGCQINMEPVSEFFFGKRPLIHSDWETQPVQTTEQTLPPETTEPEVTATEAPEETKKGYKVTPADGLNVRDGPGTQHAILGSLPCGEIVYPILWDNGWAYIDGSLSGWCSGAFLEELP